ncbi:hypothetical protein [Nocardia aurantiaca]|uniref:Uncharacterized protein n=1 Tax=Nocardia aurantiaca TaxID=2675850 RepID=A0A6I3KUU6_9NOCA|nr:hypothetical protein [Nocardia aurantiaca]MTE12215.1 hypothetical protein [Nocardia aurantiaca]
MPTTALSAIPRELPTLVDRIARTLSADEARAFSEAARSYANKGAILEIAAHSADESESYEHAVRTWRTPLRLLLILDPPSDSAAVDAYDDWVHWIAGGGLLALRGSDVLHRRAADSGKFRELTAVGALRVLQRIAACN